MYEKFKDNFYNTAIDINETLELVKILNCAIWNNEISDKKVYILSLSEIIEQQLKNTITKMDKTLLEIEKL